jgi:hypothetical protein
LSAEIKDIISASQERGWVLEPEAKRLCSLAGLTVPRFIWATGVEIYRDIIMRMAPIGQEQVESMVRSLKAHQLLEGYRGSAPISMRELTRAMVAFSDMVMDLEGLIESIDLNPLLCTSDRCVVADARIMLATEKSPNVPGIPK